MSGPSHPRAKPNQLSPRTCEPTSLESGAVAKSDVTFDDSRTQFAIHTPSTSTRSTSSEGISYTPYDRSIYSPLPRVSALWEPGDTVTSASGENDPILQNLASRRLSGTPAALHTRQGTRPGSPSSSVDGTGSDGADSGTTDLNLEQYWAPGTPATSDASEHDGADLGLDQDHGDPASGWADRDASLLGLELPRELRDRPLFCDAKDGNEADVHEIDNEFLIEYTRSRARSGTRPWTQVAEDCGRLNSDGVALAPSPGPAYDEYYLTIGKYTRPYQKIKQGQQANLGDCKTQPTDLEFCDELATIVADRQRDISAYVLAQSSTTDVERRPKRSDICDDRDVGRISKAYQQQNIPHSVDSVTLPLETLVSIFHPSFLVAHLSRSSVSILSNDLYAPRDFACNLEYDVGFTLGFGPPINLNVCAFTPREKRALRSYQKHKGNDELQAQESLPIALDLFSVEKFAEEIDAWLDGIIDSDSELLGYVSLVMLRQEDDHYSHLLSAFITWYMASKHKLSKSSRSILRPALKLLITTTLLGLVFQVTDLPKSLFDHLTSQYSAEFSTDAPRLLTRQVKASVYHLQQHLLRALFCHFTYATKLKADVKLAVAFLVAYVLDVLRRDGRQFAKYLSKFNPTMTVTDQDIAEYETKMQNALFERVRASVSGVAGRTAALGDMLRNPGSSGKGKEKESEEYQFVTNILDTVL